jgi:RNA-directed DNA polymerase
VLDADISNCFDRINHDALLKKLNTYPTLRRQIRAWLKAGVMDGNKLFPTDEGTPQGGVISPLLANVALHGIEELIMGLAPKFEMRDCGGHTYGLREKIKSISLIRYAEDFVSSCKSAKPKPPVEPSLWVWENDMLVMTY